MLRRFNLANTSFLYATKDSYPSSGTSVNEELGHEKVGGQLLERNKICRLRPSLMTVMKYEELHELNCSFELDTNMAVE